MMLRPGPPAFCPFCEPLVQGADPPYEPILVDDLLRLAHPVEDDGPTYLGNVVVQTRRHTEHGLPSLTDEEGARIGVRVAQLSRALRDVTGAAWTYTYCFTEAFRHVHQFVVARYAELPEEHVRLGIGSWRDAPRGDRSAVRRLARELAARLSAHGPQR